MLLHHMKETAGGMLKVRQPTVTDPAASIAHPVNFCHLVTPTFSRSIIGVLRRNKVGNNGGINRNSNPVAVFFFNWQLSSKKNDLDLGGQKKIEFLPVFSSLYVCGKIEYLYRHTLLCIRDEAQKTRLRDAAEDAKNGDKTRGGGGRGSCSDTAVDDSTNETIDRVARYRFDYSSSYSLPLFRVASSAQQIPALPECVCFPSSSFSEVLASFVFISFQIFAFWFYCLLFLMFPVLLALLCCVLVPGTLAFHLNL